MGGGDLNMKKSWHPLLIKNQERVWLEERKALGEKRKLDQLRKEKEEERHMQELQRLQEEQTGKKRSEKLEWMYATPASGGSTNPNDLEDYLLGKKRVDKVLTGDDNAKLGAAHRSFIAVQSANTARDMAAKIREDPLLAIKQQEQAAYQALISNPLRLKAMKEKVGIKEKDSKKEKKHKHKHHHHHRHQDSDEDMDHRRDHGSRRLSRSPRERALPSADHRRRLSYSRSRSPSPPRHRLPHTTRAPARTRSISPPNGYENREFRRSYDDRRDRDRHRRRSRSRTPPRQGNSRDRPLGSGSSDDRARRRNSRSRSPAPPRERMSPPRRMTNGASRPNGRSEPSKAPPKDDAAERAARIAAMSEDANSLEAARATRLAALAAAEEAERKADDAKRKETFGKNGTGQGSFMRDQSKLAYGGSIGLEERLRRGRGGLVRDMD